MSRIVFENETRRKAHLRAIAIGAALTLLAGGFWLGHQAAKSDSSVSERKIEEFAIGQHADTASTGQTSNSDTPAPRDQPSCTVTDGDTLKCGTRDIRLLGLDAPELPGHCRAGRECVEGDPFASSAALQALIDVEALEIVIAGKDHFGRDLANVYANGKNVGCELIASGHAVYVAKWDEGEKLRRDCGLGT